MHFSFQLTRRLRALYKALQLFVDFETQTFFLSVILIASTFTDNVVPDWSAPIIFLSESKERVCGNIT